MSLRADARRNRERLLEVAREELASGNLSMQLNDIARKAGVGVGTAYRHFATPQALLEAAVGEQLAELVMTVKKAMEIPDTRSAIAEMLRSTLRLQLRTDGGLAAVLQSIEDVDEQTTRAKCELMDSVHDLLERAYAEKIVRPDLSAEDIRNLMCGVEYAVRIGSGDEQDRLDRYLAVLLDGMRPTA